MNYSTFISQCVAREGTNEGPKLARLVHAGKGMATEGGELVDISKKHEIYGKDIDEVNLVEELGDYLWYMAIACDTLGMRFEELETSRANYPVPDALSGAGAGDTQAIALDFYSERLVEFGAYFLSRANATRHFSAPLQDAPFKPILVQQFSHLKALATAFGVSMEDVMQANVDKLEARYGAAFSGDAATQRDLKVEREALEGSVKRASARK